MSDAPYDRERRCLLIALRDTRRALGQRKRLIQTLHKARRVAEVKLAGRGDDPPVRNDPDPSPRDRWLAVLAASVPAALAMSLAHYGDPAQLWVFLYGLAAVGLLMLGLEHTLSLLVIPVLGVEPRAPRTWSALTAVFLAGAFTEGLSLLADFAQFYAGSAPWLRWLSRTTPALPVVLVGNLLRHRYWRLSSRRYELLKLGLQRGQDKMTVDALTAQLQRLGNKGDKSAKGDDETLDEIEAALAQTLRQTERGDRAGTAPPPPPPAS